MRDYIKRLFIALIMALCVSLLFLGGKQTEARMQDSMELKESWIWPTEGVISDVFGTRHGKHKGIDIAGKLDSPIIAVEDGIVGKSYYSNTYGQVIFINHPNHFVTVYAHLNKRLVKEGQEVIQGEKIGTMGRTGQSTGVHLHFETHQLEWTLDKKNAFNPEKLLGKKDVGELVISGLASSGDYAMAASSHLNQKGDLYIVQAGDTLTSIAKKNKLSVAKLIEFNQLASDVIKPNQMLIISE